MVLKNIQEKIDSLLDSKTYDIRITNNARFTDQKCTPDILNSVADAIVHYIEVAGKNSFSIKDIWRSSFAGEVMVQRFHKPEVSHPSAENEYDKVFSQPIKLLTYAGVLQVTRAGSPAIYEVANEDILNYISISDVKALDFLIKYLSKVLKDSNVYSYFEMFFSNPNKNNFEFLKNNFTKFIIDNTPVNTETEIRRIFTKIINPLAYNEKTYGTEKGRLSKAPISYTDLFYNRVNFRDIKKPKDLSRKDFVKTIVESSGTAEAYQVDKAKREVKKYHQSVNEVNRYDTNPADHVHHIFPRSQYPELSDTFENLILINPTQHLSFAHPSGNTGSISKGYQFVCLLSKITSIQESMKLYDGFYEIDDFIRVVNTGLESDLIDKSMGIELIQKRLVDFYVKD